ncbi:hormogonium polysaccharide biosynthesis glycosyltransferase HpsP [Spirulina major CS-329]|uniref:hormogonium polysaccharide biosynthesis glycosyltransferase HpsP n=1 Tax=Spirulina TaxID=1154 RepID=UPI00232E359B|nr:MULTISPECIES: hormogonium polysaccharide biosynthesis glycosyltransferase HpsP [Spirulina]MDB9493990.1 hormogonium polysaccharide biosynthesis glycosyltransferase HpsP [Spirulina subsalsa CS-330]MDB9502429.1 hormogonium polysaccharide biosynthesis glycosyltransferase HpsP [Spirulina major CS-329]
MKVLQIVPSISLVYGGPSQMVRGLSAALARQGVEVEILTTDANGDVGQAPLDVPLNQPVAADGYTVRYFRCAPFRRYKFSWGLLQWLRRHASEYDLAHVHALFSPVSSAAATILRWQGCPYVLRPLGTLDPQDLQKKRRLKALYGHGIERPNIAGAAAVHFTSTTEAETSHRYGVSSQDWVIPLGVTLPELPEQGEARSRWHIAPDRPLLVYMSRLDRKKGIELLITALARLQGEGVPFHFVLAGSNSQDPGYEQELRQRIEAAGLMAQTTIAGFVQGTEKTALLQDADLFVLPSYYENFGIAVAEAMAVGTPVVVSNGVDLWPAVERAEAGWVTRPEVEALTDSLRVALSDRTEQARRGRNALQLVQNDYSWDAIATQMIAAYRTIIPTNAA